VAEKKRLSPVERGVERERLRLIDESERRHTGPYRLTNEAIKRERVRFDAAKELVARGKVDAARRVAWWPVSKDFPREHWSRVPLPACGCSRLMPDGPLGLCGVCRGATNETPDVIPIRRIPVK
jgi:hypothetical protein